MSLERIHAPSVRPLALASCSSVFRNAGVILKVILSVCMVPLVGQNERPRNKYFSEARQWCAEGADS